MRWDGTSEIPTPPPGARRNDRRRPKGPERRRIADTLLGTHNSGLLMLDFIAATRPDPRGTHDTDQRAETVALLYRTAVEQGACPREAIGHLYGVPTDSGYGSQSSTVDRWIGEARERGYLAPYDQQRDAPKRWPTRLRDHPFAPRRGAELRPSPQPRFQGAYDGSVITLFCWRTPCVEDDAPTGAVGPDVRVEPHWTTPPRRGLDTRLEHVDPLRTIEPCTEAHELGPHIRYFEEHYPGAHVRAQISMTSTPPVGCPTSEPH